MSSGPFNPLTEPQIQALIYPAFTLGSAITITGAASLGGLINLLATAHGLALGASGLIGLVQGVTGTTEANGLWPLTIPDANHITLVGSVFTNAWISGGTLRVQIFTAGLIAGMLPIHLSMLRDALKRVPVKENATLAAMFPATAPNP